MKRVKSSGVSLVARVALAFLVTGVFAMLFAGCPQEVVDTTPPGDVASLQASPGDTKVTLVWEEPADEDYDHAIVSSVPAAFNVMEVTSGVASVIISGLANDEEYTFLVKTVDTLGNTSVGTTVTATPTAEYPTVSSTSPEAGSTGVSRSVGITVAFSTDMNGDTVDEESVLLKTGGISIPANVMSSGSSATITPIDTLAANTQYVLSIKSTVTDIEGRPLAGGYSMSFTTSSAGTWSEAEFVEELWVNHSTLPIVAVDHQDRAFCLFKHSNNDIYAARYTAAGGWQAPELIDASASTINDTARIGFDADGNAIAVWSQYDGDNYRIHWSRYDDAAETWSVPEILDDVNTASYNAYAPAIAFDSAGDAVAVWVQDTTAGSGTYFLYAKEFDAVSGTWGSLMEVDNTQRALYSPTSPDIYAPRLACGGNDNYVAAWVRYDGVGYFRTNAAVFDGSSWSRTELSSYLGTEQYPHVACDSSDNAVVVWKAGSYYMRAAYFDGTSWGSATDLSTSTGSLNDMEIAVSSNGDFLAVWSQSDGSTSRIYANRLVSGGSWATAGTIIDDDGVNCYTPCVEMDSDGDAVVAWVQYDTEGNIYDAYGCTLDSGTWETAESLEDWNGAVDYVSGFSEIDLAVLSNGNAIAVWSQDDGTLLSVFSAVYSE